MARLEHPDLHNESVAARALAEDRMRTINAAWSVLADPDERAAYDRRRLGVRETRTTNRPDPDWQPYEPSSADDRFDERHDRPITSGSLPSWLAVAPVLSMVGGIVVLVGGSMIGVSVLIYAGVFALVASGVLFISAPLVALGRSRRDDRLN